MMHGNDPDLKRKLDALDDSRRALVLELFDLQMSRSERVPICSCSHEPTVTPGLIQYVWDDECPEHGMRHLN